MPKKSDNKLYSFIGKNFYILLILAFALILRLVYFMGILRGDSVAYTSYAYLLSNNNLDLLTESTDHFPGLNRPGLYAPAALFIKIFGANEYAAVLFPLLASLATCFFIYRLACILADEEAGLLAAFFWAVFPLDIFMATQLDPEGPLSMATSGSIYLLTVANMKTKRAQKIFFYLLSTFFIVWSFYIKQSSLPIIIVVFALLGRRYWTDIKSIFVRISKIRRPIKIAAFIMGILVIALFSGFILNRQPWPLVVNSAELSAYDISPALLLGRINPIAREDLGRGNYASLKRDLITPPAPAKMLTENTPKFRFLAFDAFVPMFIIAATYAVIARKSKYYLPLIWFGILFFYLEWGVYPRSFSFNNLFVYLPISHWISADNFLFLSAPVLMVISLFISERVNHSLIRKLIVWAMIAVLAAASLITLPMASESFNNYLGLSLVLTLSVGFFGAGNLSILTSQGRLQNYVFSSLVFFIGISALNPSQQYHVSDFYKEQERRENLLATAEYLADQPAYPIYTEEGPINRLNLRSGFEYGYPSLVKGYKYPESRFTNKIRVLQEVGGYSISYGCGQPVEYFIRWPTAEFGDPDSSYCISLHRYLPAQEVASSFANAQELVLDNNSAEALEQYIAASADSKDLGSFVDAVSQMVTLYPENNTILLASGIIKRIGLKRATNRGGTDLLASYSGEGQNNWEFGDRLEASLSVLNGKEILQIEIEKPTQEIQPISLTLNLKSNTAYVLEFVLTSFAPYDLVRFPNASIPDSYADSWNRSLSWTKHQVVFVTPSFSEAVTKVSMELARIFDRGDIQFRKINLIEVVPNE